ncbi:hypothetical protein ACT4R9_10625 [Ornithobacterium rhinotracheale]|uniref:hypothetical protein n=1 Tax=Ornithobacterium rhinotracheale TaxID=28251 RepID=UPI003FA49930
MKDIKSTKVQNPVHINKRRVANKQGFMADLTNNDVKKIFGAFNSAKENFNKIMSFIPVEARARGFEAGTFNSCVIHELIKAFPINCKFWKYKRFVLDIGGYSILIKKFNKKGMPMNIKTIANSSILNQVQTTLFDVSDYEKPIVFFGWNQNNSGELINPNFVYIDDEITKWRLYEDDIENEVSLILPSSESSERKTAKLKQQIKQRKAK